MKNNQVVITKDGNKISIKSPFNPFFVNKIRKSLSTSKYDSNKQAWTTDVSEEEEAKKIVEEYYGIENEDLINVLITFKEEFKTEYNEDLVFFKLILIQNESKLGHKILKGVTFEKGSCESDGSTKYHYLRIKKDSILKIRNVPYSLFLKSAKANKDENIVISAEKVEEKEYKSFFEEIKENKDLNDVVKNSVVEQNYLVEKQNKQTTHTNNENVCILTIQQQQQLIEMLKNPKSNNNAIIESKENTVLNFDLKQELLSRKTKSFNEKGRYNIYISTDKMEKAKILAENKGLNVSNLIENFFDILDKLL